MHSKTKGPRESWHTVGAASSTSAAGAGKASIACADFETETKDVRRILYLSVVEILSSGNNHSSRGEKKK